MLRWTLLDEKLYTRPDWSNPMRVRIGPYHFNNRENQDYYECSPGVTTQELTLENLFSQVITHLSQYGSFSKGDFWSHFHVTKKINLLDQEKKQLIDEMYDGV